MATKLPKRFEDQLAQLTAERNTRRQEIDKADNDGWWKIQLWYLRRLEELYHSVSKHVGGLLWEIVYDAEKRVQEQIQEAVRWLNEFGTESAK